MTRTTGHVGVNVTELDRSVEFYGAVLGLQRVGGSDEAPRRYAFLGDGTRLVLTLWEQSAGRFDPSRPGLHHLSFEAGSVAELEAAEALLRERGATIVHDRIVPHAEGAASGGLFFEDPDGNRLELYTTLPAGAFPAAGDGPACGFF